MKTQYDVIVCGGGTAGAVAALASARQGAKTLVVEYNSYLGGMAAIGMTWGGMFDASHKQIVRGIPHELVQSAAAIDGGLGYTHGYEEDSLFSALASVDPEIYRYLLAKELKAAGCDVMLFSSVSGAETENGRVASVLATFRGKQYRLKARTYIDATGDASLAALSGMEFASGREDGTKQMVTCIFRVGNVDTIAFERYMQRVLNNENREPYLLEHGFIRDAKRYWCPWKFDSYEGMPKIFSIYWHGHTGDIYINCAGTKADELDPLEMADAALRQREEIRKVYLYMKKHVYGFENSYLSHIFDLSARESRRIKGRYTITLDDINGGKTYDDTIGWGAYPPDLHSTEDSELHMAGHKGIKSNMEKPRITSYQLPYSSMVSDGLCNIIVAGRCVSTSFDAQAATRGIAPCMVEGQAAGTAAAISCRSSRDAAKIDVEELRNELRKADVYLG